MKIEFMCSGLRTVIAFCLFSITNLPSFACSIQSGESISKPEFSTGGFFFVENAGREVFNFNVGWRFFKGVAPGAEDPGFGDGDWQLVNLPHGLELLPDEASGSMNYQGEAWYRKKFTVPTRLEGKKLYLNFEAVMGKSKVWINGKFMGGHFGGYLPFIIDISGVVNYDGTENSISVLADNSNDTSYAPGRSQQTLDFSYFGGIYRDVWLISMDKLHVTNPNFVDKTAGGGIFVHFKNLSEEKVTVAVNTEIQNEHGKTKSVSLQTLVKDKKGTVVAQSSKKVRLRPNESVTIHQEMDVVGPNLWSPQDPYLYDLFTLVKDADAGTDITDGFRTRIGIRKIEFLGEKGFYLNNKPYEGKLMGANRHQDFAYVGNALSNSLHWRDARKLKEAGCNIIRTAHYPQDPAFMDACDELGVFYIEATPGWQFWNEDSVFIKRVFKDIKNVVRRNRNRPSVIMWEPILNEAKYPAEFARKAVEIVKEEYPYEGCYTAADNFRPGAEYFDILYAHPFRMDEMHRNYIDNTEENRKKYQIDYSMADKCFFTREFGDCVESFSYQNAPNRAHRSWGEQPQITQALHLAAPEYLYTSYETISMLPPKAVGGCLWHAFDHQRGYHIDTFYGGIMDIFRQPKYSWYMFKSQQKPGTPSAIGEVVPMVFIAHEMTPFSPSDVVVFSNCDEVRLTVNGEEAGAIKTKRDKGLPYYPAVFKDVYRFYDLKAHFRSGDDELVKIVAEGIIDGKVVATTVKKPSLKTTKIELKADYSGCPVVADGSDIITVIASVTDEHGVVKRLNNKYIEFTVAGEGELIGDPSIHANPRRIEWGTAPALVRSSTKPGTIQIMAKLDKDYYGFQEGATLTIETIPSSFPMLHQEERKPGSIMHNKTTKEINQADQSEMIHDLKMKLEKAQMELNKIQLREIEKNQEDSEIGK